jgi:hypothetical protein
MPPPGRRWLLARWRKSSKVLPSSLSIAQPRKKKKKRKGKKKKKTRAEV